MTNLTLADRFWRGVSRYVERPILHYVGPQPILRRIFGVTGPLQSALPKGAAREWLPDGSLRITPKGVAPDAPLLLYLHGGGFTIGSPRTHAALAGHLAAAAGMRVQVQRYRLAPEHPYPAAKTDAIAAYDALVASGTPPAAVCGDSAGGCLALQVALHARDTGAPQPRALGLIAPIADLSGDVPGRFAAAEEEILIPPAWPERIRTDYLAGQDPDQADVSPLLGDLHGLPPTLIQAGSGEALVHDAKRLEAAMDTAILDQWPGMAHVWHLHAGVSPAANTALTQMGAFLRAQQ